MWHLEVPSKIKNFVWRAGKDALSVKNDLFRKKIYQDGQCDICKARDEDGLHALFFCSEVQTIWGTDPQWKWVLEMKDSNIQEVFKKAFSEKNDVEFMAYIGWAIWNGATRFASTKLPVL